MDKRWIYIIIIAVAGIGCLYLIAESSTDIASANININKFIVSVPPSFNIEKDGGDQITLINRGNGERINMEYLGKTDINENLTDEINSMMDDENITVIKNTTIKINNENLPSIYYEKLPNNKINQIVYLTKFNHKFLIECTDFHNNKTVIKNIEHINETLKKDFKQNVD